MRIPSEVEFLCSSLSWFNIKFKLTLINFNDKFIINYINKLHAIYCDKCKYVLNHVGYLCMVGSKVRTCYLCFFIPVWRFYTSGFYLKKHRIVVATSRIILNNYNTWKHLSHNPAHNKESNAVLLISIYPINDKKSFKVEAG